MGGALNLRHPCNWLYNNVNQFGKDEFDIDWLKFIKKCPLGSLLRGIFCLNGSHGSTPLRRLSKFPPGGSFSGLRVVYEEDVCAQFRVILPYVR